MKREQKRWFMMGSLLLVSTSGGMGCGPSPQDLVGKYEVSAQESLTECDRATPRASIFAELSEVSVVLAESTDYSVTLGDCVVTANMNTAGDAFVVSEQKCLNVSLDDETAKITLSGEGQVLSRALQLALSGVYEGTDSVGYPVTCTWNLTASTPTE